jgi:hypothetical protein
MRELELKDQEGEALLRQIEQMKLEEQQAQVAKVEHQRCARLSCFPTFSVFCFCAGIPSSHEYFCLTGVSRVYSKMRELVIKANAEQIQRKKELAEAEREEERRIAEYIKEREARSACLVACLNSCLTLCLSVCRVTAPRGRAPGRARAHCTGQGARSRPPARHAGKGAAAAPMLFRFCGFKQF